MEEEINQMLEKDAIIKADPSPDQFLSNIFIISKKDGGKRSVINSKKLHNFIHCARFRNGGFVSCKGNTFPKRFDEQSIPKGCLLL